MGSRGRGPSRCRAALLRHAKEGRGCGARACAAGAAGAMWRGSRNQNTAFALGSGEREVRERERGSCPLRGNQCAKLQEKQMTHGMGGAVLVIRIATRPAHVMPSTGPSRQSRRPATIAGDPTSRDPPSAGFVGRTAVAI